MIKHNSIIEINTKKLINNYKIISRHANNSIVGVTIKANAYGLGDKKIFDILYKNGCRHFFLASLDEAIILRKKYSQGFLYVLNGLENHTLDIFDKFNIIPILVSENELNQLFKSNYYNKKNFKFGIQIDTGINRLGIQIENLDKKIAKNLNLHILVSHLASSDEIKNPFNNDQNNKFKSVFQLFKSIKYKSLSNSAATISNKKYHYDLIRPGISVYGGYENKKLKN